MKYIGNYLIIISLVGFISGCTFKVSSLKEEAREISSETFKSSKYITCNSPLGAVTDELEYSEKLYHWMELCWPGLLDNVGRRVE